MSKRPAATPADPIDRVPSPSDAPRRKARARRQEPSPEPRASRARRRADRAGAAPAVLAVDRRWIALALAAGTRPAVLYALKYTPVELMRDDAAAPPTLPPSPPGRDGA